MPGGRQAPPLNTPPAQGDHKVARRLSQRIWALQCAVMGVATAAATVSLAGLAGRNPDAADLLAYRLLVATALVLGWPAWSVWVVALRTGLADASWHVAVAVLAALCLLQWATFWFGGAVSLRRGREIPSAILVALLTAGGVLMIMFRWGQG